ncbi:DNA-binding protein K10-like [Phyllostomus hastatus]|uniref:DNA-binding protein K10-like n=1 Tax=Phyllostomus hastatus TaxID=9423 RepID=UPI001E685C34|nr:DNA-binding protein K10-like [Phyllostomus hastatus]
MAKFASHDSRLRAGGCGSALRGRSAGTAGTQPHLPPASAQPAPHPISAAPAGHSGKLRGPRRREGRKREGRRRGPGGQQRSPPGRRRGVQTRRHPPYWPLSPGIREQAATQDPEVSPEQPPPPVPGLGSARAGGRGSRPGKGALAHSGPATGPCHLRAQRRPGRMRPRSGLRETTR